MLFSRTFCSIPADLSIILMRELSHAPLVYARVNSRKVICWSELKNTCFLDFGQLFNIQYTRFLHYLHVSLTTFMVVITYITIPTYKYPSKFPISSHHLTFKLSSLFSPISLLLFFFKFLSSLFTSLRYKSG